MKNRVFIHGFLLIVAFTLGRYVLPSPASGITGISDEAVEAYRRGDLSKSPSISSRTIRKSPDQKKVVAERVAGALGQEMLIEDYFQRHRRIMERLDDIDASNWQEVYDEFRNTTRDFNIENDELWPKMLVKIGQEAGEEALNHWISEDQERYQEHLLHVMWGWAMADPLAAVQFYRSNTDLSPETKFRLLSRVAGGIALTNPGELAPFIATLSEEEQNQTIGHSVWNLIHGGGIERANDWLDDMEQNNFTEQFKTRSFQEVARAVTKRIAGTGGEPGQEWFARYGSSDYMTPGLVGEAAAAFRNEHSLDGLEFLKTASDFPALRESQTNPPGLPAVIQNAANHDPDQLAQWLEKNRDAPFYPAAAQHYGAALDRAGFAGEAAKWREEAGE